MTKTKPKKIIQAPIREAFKQRLKSMDAKELDRLYVKGYKNAPEDLDWARASVKLLSKRLPKEKW